MITFTRVCGGQFTKVDKLHSEALVDQTRAWLSRDRTRFEGSVIALSNRPLLQGINRTDICLDRIVVMAQATEGHAVDIFIGPVIGPVNGLSNGICIG